MYIKKRNCSEEQFRDIAWTNYIIETLSSGPADMYCDQKSMRPVKDSLIT